MLLLQVACVTGDTGDTGTSGPRGHSGATGDTGSTGATGVRGSVNGLPGSLPVARSIIKRQTAEENECPPGPPGWF